VEAIRNRTVGVVISERTLEQKAVQALPCPVASAEQPGAGLIVELTGERDCRGASAVRRARELGEEPFVIAVASSISRAVTQQAVRLRIDDFFVLPEESAQLRAAVSARLEGRESEPKSAREPEALRGLSPQIETLRRYVDRVALADSGVLITGETGSGKELVAQMLHRQGPRRNGPFVSVNAAALPESLFESEMFGY
jgi:DNA-binding NtrC family response regulator